MNSLVVFLSVMALAAAEPSAIYPAGVIGYGPAVVAQQYNVGASAVTHQSRVDVKSTPTVVSTEIVQPIARTVVAQPAVVATPSYVAPLAYQAPLAYAAAPVAVAAPVGVSHQSRLDIKSSPAIVSTVATAPVYRTVFSGPALTYGINYPTILNSAAIAPVAIAGPAPAVAAVQTEAQAVQTESSAELPQAPSETPEVAAARAAHLEAKAEIEEAHKIQKRSLVVPAPLITSYATPIKYAAGPALYSGYPGYSGFYSTYPSAPIVRYF